MKITNKLKLYSPQCMNNNKQMKLHSSVCMENNRHTEVNTASFVCYFPYTHGIQLCLFVIFHTPMEYSFICLLFSIQPGEYSFISLNYFTYTQGYTAAFVCIFHAHGGIQLHLFVIVHTLRGIK
jgi:hypothetical protein